MIAAEKSMEEAVLTPPTGIRHDTFDTLLSVVIKLDLVELVYERSSCKHSLNIAHGAFQVEFPHAITD